MSLLDRRGSPLLFDPRNETGELQGFPQGPQSGIDQVPGQQGFPVGRKSLVRVEERPEPRFQIGRGQEGSPDRRSDESKTGRRTIGRDQGGRRGSHRSPVGGRCRGEGHGVRNRGDFPLPQHPEPANRLHLDGDKESGKPGLHFRRPRFGIRNDKLGPSLSVRTGNGRRRDLQNVHLERKHQCLARPPEPRLAYRLGVGISSCYYPLGHLGQHCCGETLHGT